MPQTSLSDLYARIGEQYDRSNSIPHPPDGSPFDLRVTWWFIVQEWLSMENTHLCMTLSDIGHPELANLDKAEVEADLHRNLSSCRVVEAVLAAHSEENPSWFSRLKSFYYPPGKALLDTRRGFYQHREDGQTTP